MLKTCMGSTFQGQRDIDTELGNQLPVRVLSMARAPVSTFGVNTNNNNYNNNNTVGAMYIYISTFV